jgi:alginate O-acetyltransferase complex protein AlgI
VYIPLGGSRKGLGKTLINLLIVFALTGIWHGANFTFLLWGLIYALLLIVEKLFLKKALDKNPVKFLNHIYVMLSVIMAWVFFRADNIQRAGRFIAEMFRAGDGEYSVLSFLSKHGIAAMAAGIVFCFPIYPYLKKKTESNTKALKVLTPVHTVILILLFVYSMIVIVSGSYNPFIYYRF